MAAWRSSLFSWVRSITSARYIELQLVYMQETLPSCLYCRKKVKTLTNLGILKLTHVYKCQKPKQNISKQNSVNVHCRKHWVNIRKETSKIHYLNISRKKMIISIGTEKVVDNIQPLFKHKNSKLTRKRIFLGWERISMKSPPHTLYLMVKCQTHFL